MCRAMVPAARSCELMAGNAVKDLNACIVVRVSTNAEVVRSKVLTVWSSEAAYATVGSSGLKITEETGKACALMRESGPRCGVEVEVPVFRRFELSADGRRVAGAVGIDAASVDQIPIFPSAPADKMRFDGPWTAIECMSFSCPYNTNVGFNSADI